MAAMAPVGYWLGAIHGGLLTEHRPWIFFSMAIGIALLFVLSLSVVPASVDPRATAARPSLRQFDYLGALLAMIGLGCIVAGLTQGSPAGWQPYTYILIIAGAATLAAFTLAERQATRPLVPMQLFSVPNFPAGKCTAQDAEAVGAHTSHSHPRVLSRIRRLQRLAVLQCVSRNSAATLR
jgi:hypothetical protein